MKVSTLLCTITVLLSLDSIIAAQGEKSLVQPFFITPRSGQNHISLDGDWELSNRETPIQDAGQLRQQSHWLRAQVPGSVQWALYRAGELPHPYDHMNAKKYAWVLGKTWYYRKVFQAPAFTQSQYVFLCFDGIDYYARIWLNGQELGRHEGMFSGPMVEVSSLLHANALNELLVEVRAANYGLGDRFQPWAPGKVTAAWGLTGGLGLITGGGGRNWATDDSAARHRWELGLFPSRHVAWSSPGNRSAHSPGAPFPGDGRSQQYGGPTGVERGGAGQRNRTGHEY